MTAKKTRKTRSRKARMRRFLLTMSLMLVACVVSIGGTLAWLTDTTKPVVNTFSTSDITIWMTETVNGKEEQTTASEGIENNSFKMVPGTSETKDPKVVIQAGSEDSWVFLKVTEKIGNNLKFSDYIEYAIDTNNWTKLDVNTADGETIYYSKYTHCDDRDIAIKVLKDEKVSYPAKITKADMKLVQAVQESGAPESFPPELPSLSFEAYAVQMATFEEKPLDAYNTLNFGSGAEPTPEG